MVVSFFFEFLPLFGEDVQFHDFFSDGWFNHQPGMGFVNFNDP